MVFYYSQSWDIKLCYKPYTKGENKDSCPSYITSLVRLNEIFTYLRKNFSYTMSVDKVKEGVHLTLPPHIFSVLVKSRSMLHHGAVGASSE